MTRPSAHARTLGESPADRLMQILDQLLNLHLQLRDVLARKLEGLRRADLTLLRGEVEAESALLESIEECEKQRCDIARRLARSLGLPTASAPRFSELVDALQEDRRPRAGALVARLRDLLEEIGRMTAAMREAALRAGACIRHVLERALEERNALGHPRVYRHDGKVSAPVSGPAALDLRK